MSLLFKVKVPIETYEEAKISRKNIYDKSKIGIRFTKLFKWYSNEDEKRDLEKRDERDLEK